MAQVSNNLDDEATCISTTGSGVGVQMKTLVSPRVGFGEAAVVFCGQIFFFLFFGFDLSFFDVTTSCKWVLFVCGYCGRKKVRFCVRIRPLILRKMVELG